MLYHYSAIDVQGNPVESDYEADTLDQVLQFLRGKDLRPIAVQALGDKRSIWSFSFVRGISISDKVFLTKYLALMLRVGIDLLSAVNILISDFDKPAVSNFLLDVRANLTKGQPFWTSFASHPKSFSPTFVSLVKAAELSGNLEETFQSLSVSTERDAELQSRIRAAFIYPIILLVMAAGIVGFLTTFALPKIATVFAQSGVKPPLFSQIVFTVGLFIGSNIVTIALALVALGVFLTWGCTKTQIGKRAINGFLVNAPVLKTVYQEISLQRMARTISSLMRAGLPILDTINIASQTVGHQEFKSALARIANEGLAKGLTIGEAFRRETVFPKTVTNLIAISEQAGHLDEVLGTLADFYEANIDTNIKTLMSLLEPVLLFIMGAMVAVIALSIIIPVYQLTTQF
jgi:type IV pilus assembly protein PilC